MGGTSSKPSPAPSPASYLERSPPPRLTAFQEPSPPPPPEPSPPPPRPPSPLTSAPWRNISKSNEWNEDLEKLLRNDIKQIERIRPTLKPNLVLVGPVGAGKSSFVNAILSVAQGRKIDLALTATASGENKSCTTYYDKYTDNSLLKNFRLRDCMGIEQSDEEGFNVADMVALLKGKIKDGYKFNPRSPITSENSDSWRAHPGLEHQTHCVVFVVDANVMNGGMPAPFVQKIRKIQAEVKQLRVPRVLILTKADVLCPEVDKDIKNIFWSIRVREALKTASEIFNIPEASIHPVMNYEDAIIISWERNIPLLLALRQITQYANDRIVAVTDHSDSD